MSSRGSLISALGLKEIQNRNESQSCNYSHTAGAVFIHISWQLHGQGDHPFIGMPELSLRILLFMSSTVYFLGTQPVGFLFVFNRWCKEEKQQGDISCMFTRLSTLVSTGLF